jgi:hypothetical protein
LPTKNPPLSLAKLALAAWIWRRLATVLAEPADLRMLPTSGTTIAPRATVMKMTTST